MVGLGYYFTDFWGPGTWNLCGRDPQGYLQSKGPEDDVGHIGSIRRGRGRLFWLFFWDLKGSFKGDIDRGGIDGAPLKGDIDLDLD